MKVDFCNNTGISRHDEIVKRHKSLQATGRAFWHQCPCSRHNAANSAYNLCWNISTGEAYSWAAESCDSWRFFDDHHDYWRKDFHGPSLIPSPCTQFTRAGIEWRR